MSDSDRTIRCLPLHSLIPSPQNVRKTPAEGAAFEQLKASIAAHGLLENLLVQPAQANGEADARHEVVAGARRLAALQVLAEGRRHPCRPPRPLPRGFKRRQRRGTVPGGEHRARGHAPGRPGGSLRRDCPGRRHRR